MCNLNSFFQCFFRLIISFTTVSGAVLITKCGHKQHTCLYCEQKIFNISRHMIRNHSEEKDVQEAMILPKKSTERHNAWQKIIGQGDFNANIEMMKRYHPPQFLVRRSDSNGDDRIPCSMCKGFFKDSLLYKHVKTCFMRDQVGGKHSTSTGRTLLNTELAEDKFREFFSNILSRMKKDEYHLHVRNDPLLIQFGTLEMQKREKDRYNDISYTLRCIAKLIMEFKSVSGKEYVFGKDLILTIVKAIKNLSDYQGARKITKPHRILKLGFSLRTLAEIATLKYINENADTKVTECQKFMYLYEGEYSIYGNNARTVYRNRQSYTSGELATKEDVIAVRSYCINEILKICRTVKTNSMGKDDYRQISITTLVRHITFNARRGGEPSKLKLADWEGGMT